MTCSKVTLEAIIEKIVADPAKIADVILAVKEFYSPKPLPWTDEPPTMPGWYWFRWKELVQIVQLKWDIDEPTQLLMWKIGRDYAYPVKDYQGQWAGPLILPD